MHMHEKKHQKPAKVSEPTATGSEVKKAPGAGREEIKLDELLQLGEEEVAILKRKWPNSYDDAHDKLHDLLRQLQGQNLPEEKFNQEKRAIVDPVRKILKAGVDYVGIEQDRSLSRRERAVLLRRVGRQMDDAGHQLDAMAAPDGYSAHMVFMDEKGGLAPIMIEIKKAVTNVPVSHWDDVAGRNRGNPNAWIGAGKEHLKNDDPRTAADYFTQALKLDPSNLAALTGRAMANFDLKNYPGAADDARAALDVKPNDPTASSILKLAEGRGGSSLSAGGPSSSQPGGQSGFGSSGSSWGGGSASLTVAASGANQSASANYTRQAQMAMSLRDYQAAIDHAGRAIELNPMNAQAYHLRAIAYSRLRKYDLALKDAAAGLKLDPRNGPLLDGKSYALNRMKDYRKALEAANIALEVNPNDAYAYRMRAMALAGLGDRDGMIAALRKAAALDLRNEAALQAALQLPAPGDLMFLFPEEDGGAPARPAGAGSQGRRFGVIAVTSIVGGFLIALGILQLFMGPLLGGLRTAYSRITGRSPGLSLKGGAPPWPAARNEGLLRGQYQILRQIGAGGMGLVYEGTDVSLERRVAIKKMRDELRLDPRLRERFVAEAKLVAALHHPHIVDIYAIVEEGDDVCLVFEYISGKTIHEIVATQRILGFAEAMGIFRRICLALDYAHGRNVIHRDLKPSNVMIDEAGYVKVMDFGIARVAKDAMTRYSVTNTVVGTPAYMAPEQEQGVVRKESDIFSLAACLYEMLCGKLPFGGSGAGMLMNKINKSYVPISRQASGLPPGIDAVFARALEPDPDQRFHSAGEFQASLDVLARVRPLT